MASSVDALIARGVQAPQIENPLDLQAKRAQVAGLGQEMQIRQQQLQEGAIKLAQAQQDQKDQQVLMQAWMQTGDLAKALPIAQQQGISPRTAFAVTQQLTAMREQAAKLDETESKNHLAHLDLANGKLNALLQDPNREQNWPAAVAQAEAEHDVPRGTLPQQYPGDDGVKQLILGNNTYSNQIKQVQEDRKIKAEEATAAARTTTAQTGVTKEAREAVKQTAEMPGIQADVAQKVRQGAAATLVQAFHQGPEAFQQALDAMPHGVAKDFQGVKTADDILKVGLTPDQAITTAETAKRDTATAANQEAERKQRQQQLGIEGARLNLERQKTGFEMGGGISDTAKMIAEGKLDPGTTRAMLRKSPGLMSQVRAVDPNFDEANIDNRYNTLKEFTSTSAGKAGGQAIALNTLIHHAELYQQVADSLKNGSFTPGNAVYNSVAKLFGSAPPTNAALVGRFLAGETGKVATGGVPAEGEIKGILSNLTTSASPDQIKQAGDTLLKIAAGRATPLMERAKQAKIDNVVQVLGPDAKAILQRRGFDPETMKPVQMMRARDPQGVLHEAPAGTALPAGWKPEK